MQSAGPIVVGTDGTETAERAVDRAGAIAHSLGAPVHVISAYSDDKTPLRGAGKQGDRTHSEQNVNRAQERLAKQGVESEAHLTNQEPGKALVSLADEQGAQMIVVGSRGMTGPRRVPARCQITSRITRSATCSSSTRLKCVEASGGA